MKLFKKICITLLFAGALSSCVKDIPEIIAPDEEPGQGQGKFFSTTISIPVSAATKATRSNNEYDGTDEESLVRGVRIVLYGDASGQVAYCKDIEAFNVWHWEYEGEEGSYPGLFYGKDVAESYWNLQDQIYFITVATEEIPRDKYKLLVLINPTDQLKVITEMGKPLSLLYEPATGKSGERGYITVEDMTGGDFSPMPEYYQWSDYSGETSYSFDGRYDNFVMLNSQGLVDIKEGNFYKTAKLAENNPVFINVERAVAKIKVEWEIFQVFSGLNYYFNVYRAPYYNYGWYYENSSRINLNKDKLRWGADITNKTSYWMRQLTDKALNKGMETQGDRDRENFYAKDGNFTGFSGKGLSERKKEFNYLTAEDVNKLPRNYGDNQEWYFDYNYQSDPSRFSYMLENTMAAEEQRGDVSTRIVVRAVFEFPSNVNSRNSRVSSKAGDELPAGDSFYVYKKSKSDDWANNNANNWENIDFFIIDPADMKKWADDPDRIPDGTQTKDNNGNPAPSPGAAYADLTGMRETIEAVRDKFGSSFDFSDPPESFVEGNLEFHKDGIGWYEAPIRHFSDNQQGGAMGYGRYGVVRNNTYNIEIGYLWTAGSAVFPEPKPEPNEKTRNIDLKFSVIPWEERKLTYEFDNTPM